MTHHSFHVEIYIGDRWFSVAGSTGSRAYVDGWLDCMDSHYPSDRSRAVREDGFVMRETSGRGRVGVAAGRTEP